MAIEILNTGIVNVFRTNDAQMLIDIKTGKWGLDEVKKEANILFEATRDAYERSILPERPNEKKVGEITVNILWKYLLEEDYKTFVNRERKEHWLS